MKAIAAIVTALTLVAAPGFAAPYPAAYLVGPRAGICRIGDGGSARFFGGAAIRYVYLPGIAAELALDYQASDAIDGIEIRTMPLTASAVLDVVSPVYASAGFGWYAKHYQWAGIRSHRDTDGDFAWHLGGGIRVARTTGAQIVLEARYHWLDGSTLEDPPPGRPSGRLEPDFWSTHLALLFPLP